MLSFDCHKWVWLLASVFSLLYLLCKRSKASKLRPYEHMSVPAVSCGRCIWSREVEKSGLPEQPGPQVWPQDLFPEINISWANNSYKITTTMDLSFRIREEGNMQPNHKGTKYAQLVLSIRREGAFISDGAIGGGLSEEVTLDRWPE